MSGHLSSIRVKPSGSVQLASNLSDSGQLGSILSVSGQLGSNLSDSGQLGSILSDHLRSIKVNPFIFR